MVEIVDGICVDGCAGHADCEVFWKNEHCQQEAGQRAAREAAYIRGVAAGRREALTTELTHAVACAADLDTLPGQQQAAAFYRLHADHLRAVLTQETTEGDAT